MILLLYSYLSPAAGCPGKGQWWSGHNPACSSGIVCSWTLAIVTWLALKRPESGVTAEVIKNFTRGELALHSSSSATWSTASW